MGLEFMEELGIGQDLTDSNTEAEVNETVDVEKSDNDLSLEQDDNPTKDEVAKNTELSEMDNLKKQIEGMEKRIADKDDFISELRSKSKDVEEVKEEVDTIEEEDFWDNPEAKYKQLQEQIEENAGKMRVQQLQIQEGYYAQTVDGYFKTVNSDLLKEAVSTDEVFAKEFNSSEEPYRVAYEYLTKKETIKTTEQTKLREEIRADLLKEMNVKESREVPPNIYKNGSGNSSSTNTDVPSDGFASIFGISE